MIILDTFLDGFSFFMLAVAVICDGIVNEKAWMADLLTVLLWLYISFESLSALLDMDGALKDFCTKAKYVAALMSAFGVISTLVQIDIPDARLHWAVFGLSGTIALFVWPRSVYRFEEWMTKKLDKSVKSPSLRRLD